MNRVIRLEAGTDETVRYERRRNSPRLATRTLRIGLYLISLAKHLFAILYTCNTFLCLVSAYLAREDCIFTRVESRGTLSPNVDQFTLFDQNLLLILSTALTSLNISPRYILRKELLTATTPLQPLLLLNNKRNISLSLSFSLLLHAEFITLCYLLIEPHCFVYVAPRVSMYRKSSIATAGSCTGWKLIESPAWSDCQLSETIDIKVRA